MSIMTMRRDRDTPADVQDFGPRLYERTRRSDLGVRRIMRRGAREVEAIASRCAARLRPMAGGVKKRNFKSKTTTLHEAD